MRRLWLVAQREVHQSLRRRSFWIVTAVMFIASLAVVVGPNLVGSDRETDVVAAVDVGTELEPTLAPAVGARGHDLRLRTDLDADRIASAVDDGSVDVGVVGPDARIVVRAGEHDALVADVQQAVVAAEQRQRLLYAGLADAEVAGALDVAAPPVDAVASDDAGRRAAAAIAATVLYLLLFGLTAQVANGVAVEKATRVTEVLLAVVPPSPLLFGKVLGIGLTWLAGLVIGASPLVVRALAGGDLPAGAAAALASGAGWLVLGLALYLVVAGALGAMVDRPEQAGSSMAPLMVVLIASLVVGQSAPDSAVATVLAYVPLSSPVVEPARIAVGASSPVEMVVSLSVLAASIALAARIGAAVYGRAIVRTGRRLRLADVVRST